MTNLYWIRSPNFGDALNPLLHKAITGHEPNFIQNNKAENTVLAIGSIAHCAYPGHTIWGTGAMHEGLELFADSTTIIKAVRGPLTAWLFRKMGADVSDAVFADPAILIPRYFDFPPEPDRPAPSLVIPHYVDCDKAVKYDWGAGWKVLSPMGGAEFIIQRISHASIVVTSSLHALIVAEAYGVPAVWVEFGDDVAGKGFKFFDYYLSTLRNPPQPLQIRGAEIPFPKLWEAFDAWTGPAIDMDYLGDKLMDCCPFT